MSIHMLPPISSLVPELLQQIDSYLSPPDQLFLRQANRAHIRDKLWAAQPLSLQDRIVYAVRKAFYAYSGQRRSGCYSQDEVFCRGCMALRPASRFDDKTRTFSGPLPVTTEEILQAGSNRFCITCSLNLSPIDGTPEAYHSAQIISVAGRSLSRCLCCQKLQGKLLRTCFGHGNWAIFKNGCPVCGVCESCYANGPHNCGSLLRAHRQSLSMLVHHHDYPTIPVVHFTTDGAIAETPEYQEGVHRLRYSFYKMDIFRKEMFRRYSYRPKGEPDHIKLNRRTKSAR
ncbi:MAG: hypothetical protein M1840_008573 [Geoglossum simile]|nr:MAG: hypothetical protein M1840_008573 [Geoglossum simile]